MSSIKQIMRNRSLSRSSGGAKRIATSAIPKVDDKTLQTWVKSIDSAVKEVLKQSLTSNDLVNIGLVKFDNGKLTSLIPKEEEVNLTVPLAILNLSARGAYGSVTVIWNTPKSSLFGMNIVYRSELNDFGTAVQVGSTAGDVYTDYIGNNHKVYYWVRTVSKYGVEGHLSPSAYAATSIDIDYLLENLNEKIDESLLDQALRGKIEDTADGLANEEQNRISEDLRVGLEIAREAKERALAIANESKLLNQKIAEETQNLINQIENQSNTLSQDTINRVLALQEEIQSKINTLNNGITTETENRIDEDNAIASSLTAYKTSNNNAVSTVLSKAESAITANNALSSRLDALVASLTESDGTTIDANAFNAMRAEVTTLNGTVSTLVEDVTALENSYSSALDLINTHGSAINTLQTKLTEMGNVVTQSANDITILKSDMGTVKNGLSTKAEAEAVENLETRVTKTEDSQSALSRDVTNLSASITAQAVGDAITGTKDAINALKIVGDLSKVSLVDEPTATTGKVIRLGGNNGNDYLPATSNTFIPIRADRLYRIKYRFRRFAGTSNVYIGLICANSDKTKGITRTNQEKDIDLISSEMFAVSGLSPTTMQWVEGEFYFKGRSTSASTGLGTKESPMTYPAKASYMRLCLISGYLTGAGQYDFDYIILEDAEIIALNDAQASALSSTQAQVVEIDGRVKSSADDLISLKGRVNAAEGVISQKADASALNNYFTKVEAGEAIAGQITSFKATLSTGGANLLVNSNVDKPYIGTYPHGTYALGEPWEVGATYTLLWCASFVRNSPDQNILVLAAYAGGGWQSLQSIDAEGERQVHKVTFVVRPEGAVYNEIAFFLLNSNGGYLGALATVHWAVLVKASDVLTDAWVQSKYDINNAISANAQAIRNTETAVATIDGKVTAQATDILNLNTNLTNLNNSKLDASIIQQYRTAVDQDSVTTGELTQFKSTLKIGGDNLFTGTKTFNNQSSENSTSSFHPSYGGFGGNTQEFLPNALFGTHTVVKTSSSWCGFYLREADGVSWEAQEDMVLSFWANASADVHVYGIASQLGHAATVTANQPMTKYEVLIPKGKPLRNSSNQGIIEFYFTNGGELWYGAVMLQVGTKSTSWQPSSKDNEMDTSQFASATALENLTTNVSNIDGVVSSHTNKINAHQASIDTALDVITIRDTRYNDFPPSHYRQNYALKEVREFKVSGTISLPTSGAYPSYCTLVTRTQWTDASGGNVIQRVEFDDPTLNLYRKSNDGMINWDTWSAWENKLVGSLSAKADASYVNDISNKVTQAENGLTALSNTVTENATSLVNNINLFRNSGFDATPIDGHHWQGVYWEGNESVQMSVENWGHFNIMRIRATADGNPFTGIAQELAFDDYRYTGKKLQFRFLTSSGITRTMRLGVHYRDGAGATAHQEWRKFTHTTGYTNLHTFTLPAVNGALSLRVMITEELSQSAYDWALIQPSFNTGNAPIREYVPSSQDGLYVANAAATVTTQTRAVVQEINGQVTSLAAQTNTLSTTVGDNTAAIQSHAASINGMRTQFTLKMDVNGLVSGIGMMNDGVTSDFIVNANTFAIGSPTSNFRPFIATSTETIINGVPAPAGVHINTALIANGTIKNAQIGDLSADKITTGDIHADRMKANIVEAVDGQFDNLGAITAKIGHLRTADTGARIEFKGNLLSFFDNDDTGVILIGEWEEDPIGG